MLTLTHVMSIVLTLLLVTCVGIYSMRKIKNAADFSVGGRNISTSLVAGIILGTLLGGSSTIATSQMAFTYGLSAWWFTLGSGIACIILGVFMAHPLRQSQKVTGPSFLAEVYGEKAGLWASIFSSVGIFLNIIGQILACVPLLTVIFKISFLEAALIAVLLVILYVIFGGVWGTGIVGELKSILIYLSLIVAGVTAYYLIGGISGFKDSLVEFPYFSFFPQGVSKNLAGVFAVVVGIVSTQTYLQAIFSGKTIRDSRNGAIIAGLLMPPIGLFSVLVGMFMRVNFPNINPSDALPFFVIEYLPDWIGGIILATLLIASVGTGAGLVLGVSTMITEDIYKKVFNPRASDKNILIISRITIIIVTGLTLIFVSGNMNSLILKWSFLSMGLRGATMCLPLLAAIFFKDYIKPEAGVLAVFLAPLVTLILSILKVQFIDPLYVGLLVSFGILTLGSLIIKMTNNHQNAENSSRI